MDQVTFVEEVFKRFQVIWSASAILTNALDLDIQPEEAI